MPPGIVSSDCSEKRMGGLCFFSLIIFRSSVAISSSQFFPISNFLLNRGPGGTRVLVPHDETLLDERML